MRRKRYGVQQAACDRRDPPDPEPDPLPPTVPAVRLSIRKDQARNVWVLTVVKDKWRHEYSETSLFDLWETIDAILDGHTCATCAAPLWIVNDHVVCSRHWDHYPQSPELTKRYLPMYSGYNGWGREIPPEHYLPAITPARAARINHNGTAALKAWAAKHLEVETVETKDDKGKPIIHTRIVVKPPTLRELKRKSAKLRRESHQRIAAMVGERSAHVPPGSVGDRLAEGHRVVVTPFKVGDLQVAIMDPLTGHERAELPGELNGARQKYLDYRKLMEENKIEPRPWEGWLENYQTVRARQEAKV